MSSQSPRKPGTVQALSVLKARLDAMPSVGSPKAVVDALRMASCSANPNWTVPALGDPAGINQTFPDGTVRVMLLAHQVFINPSGAYRIIDSHSPQDVFYERASSDGAPFVDPGVKSDDVET